MTTRLAAPLICAVAACSFDGGGPEPRGGGGDAAVIDAAVVDGVVDAAVVVDATPDSGLEDRELARYVRPLIGTAPSDAPNPVPGGRGGSVFPGAVVPFGMVQWSPDTPNAEPSGYSYLDTAISGFSLTHYSGAGCPNNGELPILPVLAATEGSASFSHARETATAGSYEVQLDSGIRVELTATTRTGMGRFTFPAGREPMFTVDASRTATRAWAQGSLERAAPDLLTGWTTGGNFCWKNNSYRLYVAVQADRPFARVTMDGASATIAFDRSSSVVRLKVGLSYVSVANARANLEAENPGWDLDAVRAAAREAWNQRLAAIQVDGGSEDERIELYTALFHALLFPSVFSDVGGQYLGFDGAVHTAAPGRTQYANTSGWDLYRSQIQLVAMLFPDVASDMVQSLVAAGQQCGALPRWGQNNADTGVMVGDPGAIIVASAHAFGATDFDRAAALALMLRTGALAESACNGVEPLPGLRGYLMLGYIPDWGGEFGPASSTLEYASRDFAVAQFAAALGDMDTYRSLSSRAGSWQRLIHPDGLVRMRRWDGQWKTPLAGPGDGVHESYVEGNAEQYTWMVPHDARSLFDALGGDAAVVARLDRFFTRLNAGLRDPYFYMGNQPNFATPWLYAWAGAPWRTQDVVRRIMDESFQTTPGGLPGNDDLGATSAWFVWAALGLYPQIPGVGGLAIGSPRFPRTEVRLGGGGVLSIAGDGAPARYVQTLTVDGVAHERPWLSWDAISGGARLVFALGDTPSTWGSGPANAPPSYGPDHFSSLADAHDERGISSDGRGDDANFDGLGNSYSRQALAAIGVTPGGVVSHRGVSFTWPSGTLDNTVALGQTIDLPNRRGRQLAFLAAASIGPSSGTGELIYADGARVPFELGVSDWTLGNGWQRPSFGNEIALRVGYRNTRQGSRDTVATHVFYEAVPLDASKTLAAVRLPARVSIGKVHVFAVTIVP